MGDLKTKVIRKASDKETMIKILILLLLSSYAFAQDIVHDYSKGYINAEKLLDNTDKVPVDVLYHSLVPQYEENADPKKTPTIEVFSGNLSDESKTSAQLDFILGQIEADKKLSHKYSLEINFISKESSLLRNDPKAREFLEKFENIKSHVTYENIPEDISFSLPQDKTSSIYSSSQKRVPAAFVSQRVFWTLVRVSTSTGATTASLYYTQDISLEASLAIGIWPGIASGAITYFSGPYGSWLSSGKWSKWIVESDNSFTNKLKEAFKIDSKSLSKLPASKLSTITKRLASGEEYLKWFLTELAFTTTALKIPQAVAGVGKASTFLGSMSDVLVGSAMGMLAQGPGDIALQIRKYQKVSELKESVIKGLTKVENKESLLKEIDAILARTHTINDNSHVALRKIENWARSRASMLSFFSVMGVGMEIAGIPLSRPILLSIGVGGAFYYANVQGAFTEKTKAGRFIQSMKKSATVISKTCSSFYQKGKL